MSVIDQAALATLREMGGEDTVIEAVKTFLKDEAPGCLRDLKNALSKGSAEGVRKAAHQLKSASSALGARKVAELCLALEKAGAKGAIDGAPALYEQLVEHFEAARKELAKLAKKER